MGLSYVYATKMRVFRKMEEVDYIFFISIVQFSILINGIPCDFFRSSRGLQQVDFLDVVWHCDGGFEVFVGGSN